MTTQRKTKPARFFSEAELDAMFQVSPGENGDGSDDILDMDADLDDPYEGFHTVDETDPVTEEALDEQAVAMLDENPLDPDTAAMIDNAVAEDCERDLFPTSTNEWTDTPHRAYDLPRNPVPNTEDGHIEVDLAIPNVGIGLSPAGTLLNLWPEAITHSADNGGRGTVALEMVVEGSAVHLLFDALEEMATAMFNTVDPEKDRSIRLPLVCAAEHTDGAQQRAPGDRNLVPGTGLSDPAVLTVRAHPDYTARSLGGSPLAETMAHRQGTQEPVSAWIALRTITPSNPAYKGEIVAFLRCLEDRD